MANGSTGKISGGKAGKGKNSKAKERGKARETLAEGNARRIATGNPF